MFSCSTVNWRRKERTKYLTEDNLNFFLLQEKINCKLNSPKFQGLISAKMGGKSRECTIFWARAEWERNEDGKRDAKTGGGAFSANFIEPTPPFVSFFLGGNMCAPLSPVVGRPTRLANVRRKPRHQCQQWRNLSRDSTTLGRRPFHPARIDFSIDINITNGIYKIESFRQI